MSTRTIVSAVLGAAAGAALVRSARRATASRPAPQAPPNSPDEQSRNAADDVARRYITWVIMPLWSAVGFLDWLWHRQTSIETTSGAKESVMHLLMMAEAGAPILIGLLLEMNAGSLALMSAGWLVHDITVACDVTYTSSRRVIYPREQHTHSYMQSIPFQIVATLACLYPDQFLALFGLGAHKPDFRLRWRKPPVPVPQLLAIIAAMGLLSGLPHLEELMRCLRAQRDGRAGTGIPSCAPELYSA
ncbi:diguanylate cyclase [Acidobacteria bacterium AB60]|nr:diguanylate cyclase [Acidobacteria bacterium AB60]